mmetsp:Transcript_25960/g.42528  ORF Transcript_25960/g.42528 Transcript_25960/m.42528 type:complete len:88 (+) Transcript_25960:16-279(+)
MVTLERFTAIGYRVANNRGGKEMTSIDVVSSGHVPFDDNPEKSHDALAREKGVEVDYLTLSERRIKEKVLFFRVRVCKSGFFFVLLP